MTVEPVQARSPSKVAATTWQRTVAKPVSVAGFGYWSGNDITVEFRPAGPDTGICFVRRDLDPVQRIRAIISNRIDFPRRTTLGENGATVEMVEHVLASLAGLGISNCEVWVDALEMPGCDGSSLAFVEALDSVGTQEQGASLDQLVVTKTCRVQEGASWVEARPSPKSGMFVEATVDYGADTAIGRQEFASEVTPDLFRDELATARTFVLESEAQAMLSQGICQRVTCRDLLVFDDNGPIDNPLRFQNECARHKALDLVGDLALAGCQLNGRFVGFCSGHRLNAMLVECLLADFDADRSQRGSS